MPAAPIPGVLYTADVARAQWIAPGRDPLPFDPTPPPDPGVTGWPFDEDEPWRLQPGESYLDQMPVGVPIVSADDYAGRSADGTVDLVALLNDVEAKAPSGCYVQLSRGRRHIIHTLRNFGTAASPNYLGFANSRRRVMGIVNPDGPDSGTTLETSPTMVSSSAGARAYALDPRQGDTSGPWVPVAISALYFSNTGTTVPFFFAGIDFRGALQTPYGTYSTDAQTKFRRNHAVPSPLPFNGIALWRGIPGARVQHSRFAGFGFALNNAPPFEKGAIDSNYGRELYRRLELDGRIHGDIDPRRPLASGGLMWNKSLLTRLEDARLHHTRRSGWATNTNTRDFNELYVGRRVRVDHIANPADGWAGDNGGFSGSNVEEVVGTFEYDDVWLTTEQSGQHHIVLAIPYGAGGSTTNRITLPDRPIIVAHNGFRTDDTIYGGCLRIRVIDRPNSTGISPAWQRLNDVGIAASGLFDISNRLGAPMTGVRHTAYNAALHKPDTHFIVNY